MSMRHPVNEQKMPWRYYVNHLVRYRLYRWLLPMNLRPFLTDWIVQEKSRNWLEALEEAELRGSQEDSVIRCKKQPLEMKRFSALLQDGKKW